MPGSPVINTDARCRENNLKIDELKGFYEAIIAP